MQVLIDSLRNAVHRGGCSVINGSEFSNQLVDLWAYQHQVQINFSQPGKPTDNAHVESFTATLRRECLNTHWFESLSEAQERIEAWRREYNESRPHRALQDRTPAEFAKKVAENPFCEPALTLDTLPRSGQKSPTDQSCA